MTRVDITYTCEADGCGESETVEADFGDSTDDDKVIPVGWGTDDDLKLLCAEHYTVYEDRLLAEDSNG